MVCHVMGHLLLTQLIKLQFTSKCSTGFCFAWFLIHITTKIEKIWCFTNSSPTNGTGLFRRDQPSADACVVRSVGAVENSHFITIAEIAETHRATTLESSQAAGCSLGVGLGVQEADFGDHVKLVPNVVYFLFKLSASLAGHKTLDTPRNIGDYDVADIIIKLGRYVGLLQSLYDQVSRRKNRKFMFLIEEVK